MKRDIYPSREKIQAASKIELYKWYALLPRAQTVAETESLTLIVKRIRALEKHESEPA